MEIKQAYELVNEAVNQALGKTGILKEDLTNIIDVGNEIFNGNYVDQYSKALLNQIGRIIYVNRLYQGRVPNVVKDGAVWGSVVEKVNFDLPDAQMNESWELMDGASYDPNIFRRPKVSVKFYNKMVTFSVPVSITDIQLRQSFSGPEQLVGFVAGIYTAVENFLASANEQLVLASIDAMIAATVEGDISGSAAGQTGVKAINLLYLYNKENSATLTAEAAISNPDFLRFAAYTILMTSSRMKSLSTLFNVNGKARHTPREYQRVVLLDAFAEGANVYLQSDTFHEELTRLPEADVVSYWQGSGDEWSFSDISKIYIKSPYSGADFSLSGIVGVIFDRDALGVFNYNKRVTSNYNPVAEFTNNYYKVDARYYTDTNENFVVFYMA